MDKYMAYWILFNCIFSIFGVVIVGYSSIVLKNFLDYGHINETGEGVAITFVLLGIVVLVNVFVGACIIAKQGEVTSLFMSIFLASLIVTLIMGLGACISGFTQRFEIKHNTHNNMEDLMQNYDKTALVNLRMDEIQYHLKCCGATYFTDWFATPFAVTCDELGQCVPKSCCKTDFSFCEYTNISLDEEEAGSSIYIRGCSDPLSNMLTEYITTLSIIGGLFVAYNLFGVVATIPVIKKL